LQESRGVGGKGSVSRRQAMVGATALAFGPLAGCAWFESPPPVIGYLDPISGDSPTNALKLAAFRKGLAEQGFTEGDNVEIEYRYANGAIEKLPDLAKDLVDIDVAVLVVSTPNAARAAKALTSTIPIIFGQAADAVESGEVTNLAHPEANLTGVANFNELAAQRLQLIHGMVPPDARIAYISDPSFGSFERNLRQTQEEADRLNRRLAVFKAGRDAELEVAFGRIAMANSGVGGICIGPVRGAYSRPGRLVNLAARHPKPTIYFDRAFVDAGGLMSYGASFAEIYQLVGIYTGRILNGAQPGDLPVLQPNKFELTVNAKTAAAQGLIVPPEILAEANEVIR
jgi:putative tryptophan/tyrosine transport system substrate-binding protein